MAWQGIPYKLIEDSADSFSLSITKFPHLIMESPTDYTTLVLTGAVSLVAGLIPAGIAIYTFKRNAKNLKEERIAQQDFLRKERESQQVFLKKEREVQVASFEADRKLQEQIAKNNFNMQVLSVNRQSWINLLRDALSEYLSLIPDLVEAKFSFLIMSEQMSSASENRRRGYIGQQHEDNYQRALEDFRAALDRFRVVKAKEKLFTAKIEMMLNPGEEAHLKLMGVIPRVSAVYNSLDVSDPAIYANKSSQANDLADLIIKFAQVILKQEWVRVKSGT